MSELLAQVRYWRVALAKGRNAAVLTPMRENLPEDLQEIRDLRVEIPLARWNTVAKHVQSDRKLLGGILLDYANTKELVARVVGTDRLLCELQRAVRDATLALIEGGYLALAPPATTEGEA